MLGVLSTSTHGLKPVQSSPPPGSSLTGSWSSVHTLSFIILSGCTGVLGRLQFSVLEWWYPEWRLKQWVSWKIPEHCPHSTCSSSCLTLSVFKSFDILILNKNFRNKQPIQFLLNIFSNVNRKEEQGLTVLVNKKDIHLSLNITAAHHGTQQNISVHQ